jgi:peptidoglycan-N-acetylglucosamine deacetylase
MKWPNAKRAALSLTFDDARESQVDFGLPILNRHKIPATFYVVPTGFEKRLDGWRAALVAGHELGNHTVTHPCSGNFTFARHKALEDFTLDRMEGELLEANRRVEQATGVRPKTFAYPCGQTFVGRGLALHSYVPLVARHFIAGRGYNAEVANDPTFCDLAHLNAAGFDRLAFPAMKQLIQAATSDGRWLILVGHDVLPEDRFQAVNASALDALCRYCREPESELWVDTVANIATYIQGHRKSD